MKRLIMSKYNSMVAMTYSSGETLVIIMWVSKMMKPAISVEILELTMYEVSTRSVLSSEGRGGATLIYVVAQGLASILNST